jgi:hypothetical protein
MSCAPRNRKDRSRNRYGPPAFSIRGLSQWVDKFGNHESSPSSFPLSRFPNGIVSSLVSVRGFLNSGPLDVHHSPDPESFATWVTKVREMSVFPHVLSGSSPRLLPHGWGSSGETWLPLERDIGSGQPGGLTTCPKRDGVGVSQPSTLNRS